MGTIVLTGLITAAWLLLLIVGVLLLIVLLVVGVVLVRFLLVATVAASTWAERNGADPRSYWWFLQPGERKPRPPKPPRAERQRTPPPGSRPPASPAASPQAAPTSTGAPEAPAAVAATGGSGVSQPPRPSAGPDQRATEHAAAAARTHGDGGAIASLRARLTGHAHPAPQAAHEDGGAQDAERPAARPAPAVPAGADAPTTELPAARPAQPTPSPRPGASPVPPADGEVPAPRSAASARRPTGVPPTEPAPVVDQADDRDSAIDRLFAPLADSDHTEPIPTARPVRSPRTPRQPKS